ncbi:MAG: hypothetical protein WC953_09980 [Pseudomonas sp.]
MNRQSFIRCHRILAWIGGIALLVFGISGISHPLMTWFGPPQAAFFPPQGNFSSTAVEAIPQVLASHGIERAQLVKVLPTAAGNLLQVSSDNGAVRRYFDLESGAEHPDFDARQAEWLARYYTGLADAPIRSIELLTAFDTAYPSVNRLLPVWQVSFAGNDTPTTYVHTELNALASITNGTRTLQQNLFQALHTWSWLDGAEPLRVTVLVVLCGTLAAMAVTGLIMVFVLPGRTIRSAGRRWHRRTAWLLWLPLLTFSTSGLYHLLHNAGDAEPQTLVYGADIPLAGLSGGALLEPGAAPLNSITLLVGPAGEQLYRLAQPAGKPGQHVGHHGRFDGTPTEVPARLVNAATGALSPFDDEQLARAAAQRHLGIPAAAITGTALVTRFDSDYDFRNKRLPVWRVNYTSPQHSGSAYIDPANGALVDRITNADHWEGLSFSQLHKWNFLTPFTGREIRDVLMVATILALLTSAGLGIAMLIRRKPQLRARQAAAAQTLLRGS